MPYFYAETDFGDLKAMASPVFSKRRYAEQYVAHRKRRGSDFAHGIVELGVLPDRWQLLGDQLLEELDPAGDDESHARALEAFLSRR